MEKGIYTLANDACFDQLIAFVNSIETNVGDKLPICIIPYDNNIEKVKKYADLLNNTTLFEDGESLERWGQFAKDVWSAHPDARRKRRNWLSYGHTIRKFCAFDGEFEKFVFYDVDSLAMKPLDKMFAKLDDYDFVFDDWEHNKPDEHAMLNYNVIEKTGLFKKDEIRSKMHGMDFFGSKKGIFNTDELMNLKKRLVNNKEIRWINSIGLWDDVFLFSYMTFRFGRPQFNFTQSPDPKDRTGNCANADRL